MRRLGRSPKRGVRLNSDSSTDMMRSNTGSAQILLSGIRHGSRGAFYVAGVAMLIAVVSILIKTSGY